MSTTNHTPNEVGSEGSKPDHPSALRGLRTWATRVPRATAELLRAVWKSDRLFFTALTLFNLFLARHTFHGGIWADNDSVCHYTYVRHLLEDFYPATGTFIGWTPKYDMGAPFLLYNTPPGIYVAAALVAKLTSASALFGLKAVVVPAFLAVPLAGAQLARTLEDRPGDLPKIVALTLSLFTSELFGLEFFFDNGMLNPAVALPFALVALTFFRRAQQARGTTTLRPVAVASLLFAATALTHLLTAYMLALTLCCFTIGAGARRFGRSALQAGAVIALGSGVAAFWLVPSMAFAAQTDVVFTWIRNPIDTLVNVLDGNLLSSYPVAFYPRFIAHSSAGIGPVLFFVFAVTQLARRPNAAVGACALTALVALLVVLGPRPSFGLWILPMYDRLLWYRFMTLLETMVLIVAAWGAWRSRQLRGLARTWFAVALVLGAGWAGVVLIQRSSRIHTDAEYPHFVADVRAVGDWLKRHAVPGVGGEHGGRVYSEFIGQNALESPGVNYPRHMIPELSGVPEAGGWIYENDEAAQRMLKRGLFWHNPFPMISLADRYDVRYVVAASPNFIRALSHDPRWKLVVDTPRLSLFEAAGHGPALLDAFGWTARVTNERYTRGGGYEYVIHVEPNDVERAHEMLVKTSWSPSWRARIGDHEVTVDRTDDGLLVVALPDAAPATITLTWDIGSLRERGDRITWAALAVVLAFVLVGGWTSAARMTGIPDRMLHWAGIGGTGATLVVFAIRAHPIDEHVVGFGIRDGMQVTRDQHRLEVGAYDDAEAADLVHVLDGAWSARALRDDRPARTLIARGAPAAVVALSPVGLNRVTVRGASYDSSGAGHPDAPITLTFRDAQSGRVLCRVAAALATPSALPPECAGGAAAGDLTTSPTLGLEGPGTLVVNGIDVENGIVLVEAESMHNALDDSGYEAFYAMGPPDQLASNGVSMAARVTDGRPVAVDREVPLPAPAYVLWVLSRMAPEGLEGGCAHVLVEVDGRKVTDLAPRTCAGRTSGDDVTRWTWLPAGRVDGGASPRIRLTFYKAKEARDGWADVDAIAFVPAGR